MIMKTRLLILLIFISSLVYSQKFENLAPTPPMGWNSWNTFNSRISEKLVMDIADIFEKDGYRDAGYQYIIIDDCWSMRERDANGNLVPDPQKFPNGIKHLADYVHSKGLKFGIYSDAGTKTCAGFPGSKDHELQDAKLFASWGVDYLKYDWCSTNGLKAEDAYKKIRDAIHEAGRPMVLGICEWGTAEPWKWAKDVGHLWRISGDIAPCFDCVVRHQGYSEWGVMKIVYMREGIRKYAGPDHWNDYDMMEVGTGMTVAEDRAHFGMWCMLATALTMGNDIRKAKPETVKTLTNEGAISINQDPLGIQGFKYTNVDSTEVWVKPLEKGQWAVCFLNRKNVPVSLSFDWSAQKITDPDFGYTVDFSKTKFKLYNVWTAKNEGTTKKTIKANIASHDVLMFRLEK